MDEAVIDWAYFYHPQAMAAGKEYGSNIYRTVTGNYYYDAATVGEPDRVGVPVVPNSVGWVHSHQNSAATHANLFAVDADVRRSEKFGVIPGYVVTPAGDIQRYTPSGTYDAPGGDLGTLQWIYYDWWRLSGSNGRKWFWKKNALDRRLDRLRANLGSVTGAAAYYDLWESYKEGVDEQTLMP